MNRNRRLVLCGLAGLVVAFIVVRSGIADDRDLAKDGSGVYGYRSTPIQPWSGYHVHDPDRPLPPRVQAAPAPEKPAAPPSDAIVLFDGKDLSKWRPNTWKVVDGLLEATEGALTTQDEFGDCQIHVEWKAPVNFKSTWSNQGNSGVNLMDLYEIQIFDSVNEKIYPDGMAGSIYGQTPPLVNACLPPGEWQTFDIVFTAPAFDGGKLTKAPRVTVLHNGVLVQHDEEIRGEAVHRTLPAFTKRISKGPLSLGAHSCPIRFRNIWVRPLTFPSARP